MLKFSAKNDTTVRPFHVRAGKSGLRHLAQKFAPISGSFVAPVLAASLQISLFLVFVVTADVFDIRFVESVYVVVCLRLFGPYLLNVRAGFSFSFLLGSSVAYINTVHFHCRNY